MKTKQHPAVKKLLAMRAQLQRVSTSDIDRDLKAELLALLEVALEDRHNVQNAPWFTGNTFYWERATAVAWRAFYSVCELN